MAIPEINPQDNTNIKVEVNWSNEDEAFVAKCIDYPYVAGVADTQEEAIEIFYEHLAAWQEHERQGRIAKNKGGRPKKDNVAININISKEAKLYLSYYCIQYDIKQGELVNKLILALKNDAIVLPED